MTDKPRTGAVNYRWIKYDIEYLNEPDFMQLSDSAAGAYLKFYLLAGRADAGGLLCNSAKVFTIKDLAWLFHVPEDTIGAHLEELISAGFMAVDDTGYRITRFLEEQGPGDNEQREKWRTRQAKHRANARGDLDVDLDLDLEKNRLEVEVDIESHGDVTVTPRTAAAAAATAAYTSVYQACKAEFTDGGKDLTTMESNTIKDMLSDYSPEQIIAAMQIAVNRNKRNLGYVKGILAKENSKPELKYEYVVIDGQGFMRQVVDGYSEG